MVKVKVNHYLDYTKCTVDELQKFIKDRTGKDTTSRSVPYMAAKLRVLDKDATFRFQDLPTEMRLAVYAELMHRPDPYDTKTIHSQILATSKEINREAEPELNVRGNLLIRIAPHPTYRRAHCSMGSRTFKLYNVGGIDACSAMWPLYDRCVGDIPRIQNMTIHITEGRLAGGMYSRPDQDRIVGFLYALTAAIRTSKVRTLKLRIDPGVQQHSESCLWPLYRIHSIVDFSMEGVSRRTEKRIFKDRAGSGAGADLISKGRALMTRLDELVELFATQNPHMLSKVGKLRSKVTRATRWSLYLHGDETQMKTLNLVERDLGKKGMRKSIQKAEEASKAGEKSDKGEKSDEGENSEEGEEAK